MALYKELSQKTLNLWVHNPSFSKQDVIFNLNSLPGAKIGDFVEVIQPLSQLGNLAHKDRIFVFKITPESVDEDFISKQTQLQVSVSNSIASAFIFQARAPVIARLVDRAAVSSNHVELSFRDQYIGRSDMWRFSQSMVDTCVYEGKIVVYAGTIRAQVKAIYINGQQRTSGYVSESTKAIFRSESARFYIFLQMCQEMYDFDEDGELFYEKAIHGYLPDLFSRWKKLNTNHVVSIVLFTRVYYDERDEKDINDPTLLRDINGKRFRDFYRVVVNQETSQQWLTYIRQLKVEVMHFMRDIILRDNSTKITLATQNAYAFQGNILEVINLGLNAFEEHYVDRDLLRTGLSMIVITPGTGQFQVDKNLLRMTTERMIDNGIGLDLVCLSKVPLHTVPLFIFYSERPPISTKTKDKTGRNELRLQKEITADIRDPLYYDAPENSQESKKLYYAMPHWIDASFYSRNQDFPFSSHRFVTRAKMHEVQMMGIMEHEIASIHVPLLQDDPNFYDDISKSTRVDDKYARYDAVIFKTKGAIPNLDVVPGKPNDTRSNGFHVDHQASAFKSKQPMVSELSKSLRNESIGSQGRFVHVPPDFDDTNERVASLKLAENSLSRGKDTNTRDSRDSRDSRGIDIGGTSHRIELSPDDGIFGSATVKPISIQPKKMKLPTGHPLATPPSYQSFEDAVFKWDESAGKFPRLLNNSGPSPVQNSPGRQGYKQTLINPSNPTKTKIPLSSQLRRWHHVFPKNGSGKSVRWKSMCNPACLPLSTDFFPSQEDLASHFQEYTYTISIDPDGTSSYPGLKDTSPTSLLTEMVSQRIAQGYQLLIGESVNAHARRSGPTMVTRGFSIDSSSKPSSRFVTRGTYNVIKDIDNSASAPPVYLFMSHHFHRLFYDPAGQNVEVKRFVQKLGYTPKKIHYSCHIWPKSTVAYRPRQVSFNYPDVATYNWNYLDQLIAGYQDEILDSLRMWKTRFVLIPMEATSMKIKDMGEQIEGEEIRIEGIFKFSDIFNKARWVSPMQLDDPDLQMDQEEQSEGITLNFTTLTPAAHVRNEVPVTPTGKDDISIKNEKIPSRKTLDKSMSLAEIAKEMQDPKIGVKMEDRRWHLKLYENVFTGIDCTKWLIDRFGDIDSVAEAEAFGNELMERGLFEHSNRRHCFMDGLYFYYLKSEYVPKKPSKGWFGKRSNSSLSSTNNNGNIINSNSMASSKSSSISSKKTEDSVHRSRIYLSKKMTIDLDPSGKSDRPETCFLHYDTIYNPDICYHFQMHWLGTTARFVEDCLQSWSRVADKYGLKLVEVPVNQVKSFDNDNPFQAPVVINLACKPPSKESLGIRLLKGGELPELYFETELVKRFNFILDTEADDLYPHDDLDITYSYKKPKYERTQYIHRSGVAIIQLQEAEKGLLWVHNRLYTSHNSSYERQNHKQMAAIPNVTDLRLEFAKFCSDKENLETFWKYVVDGLEFIDESKEDKVSIVEDEICEAISEALEIGTDEKASL